MKKAFIILGFLVMVLAVLWGLFSFSNVFLPRMSLSVLQINRIGADDATLKVKVDLKNRSPFSLRFQDINFSIKVDAQTLVQTDTVVPVSMKAFKETSFTVPVELKLSNIKSLNYQKVSQQQDSCIYDFNLEIINEPSFFLPDTMFLSSQEKLPLYQLPEVELVNMEPVEYLAVDGPKYNLTILVKNKNFVPLEILKPQYQVTFGGEDVLIEGIYAQGLMVPAKTEETIILPVQMDKNTLLKHANKLIFNKAELDVGLTFQGNLRTESQYVHGCNLVVKVNGNLKDLINKD